LLNLGKVTHQDEIRLALLQSEDICEPNPGCRKGALDFGVQGPGHGTPKAISVDGPLKDIFNAIGAEVEVRTSYQGVPVVVASHWIRSGASWHTSG
jgi:hypothetical protein